jgi:thiamine biosynthesis lipoprotein
MKLERFRSMGCEIVVAGAEGDVLGRIEELFHERDATFSRFQPRSELNRVNAASGRTVAVSSLFAEAISAALEAAAATGGLVDPTLGAAIEAAGYMRDFDQLEPDPRPPAPAPPGRWESIRLSGPFLRVEAGVALDLNGVVKALAVDHALRLLPGGGFVSAGGDLATLEEVDVGLPRGGAVRLVRGALATSGTATRRWWRGGELQHHLIDPRTGRPAASPWEHVTVCGHTCITADTAAKAAFLRGEDGPDWLDERGLPGRFVSGEGEIVVSERWRTSVEEAAACT